MSIILKILLIIVFFLIGCFLGKVAFHLGYGDFKEWIKNFYMYKRIKLTKNHHPPKASQNKVKHIMKITKI